MATKVFVTISPIYRSHDPFKLYLMDKYTIIKYMNRFSKHYILFPEFDTNSRLHYHGIAFVHDKVKMHKCKYEFSKVIGGFIKYDPIKSFTEHLRSLVYCQKEFADNRRLFKAPIIYKSLKRQKALQYIDPKERSILSFF